ncbi:MAG: hypothetical protein J2P29_05825 [Actinobacteria bacterium]|nr:hypothetical protein [Actinomycetota bacterium]MBO0831472.1 hypothetical protein [Actinomycetota bacterium]
MTPVQARLGQALRTALQARDTAAVAALRSAHSAISNAEAVSNPAPQARHGNQYIAGGVAGLGAAETRRRVLSAAEAEQIVRTEISDRLDAAARYDQAGHTDRAARLRHEAGVLEAALFPPTVPSAAEES